MYIIQMSDLHIGSAVETKPDEESLLDETIEIIEKNIPEKSNILIVLCGDIIDSKGLEANKDAKTISIGRYTEAARLITEYKEKLDEKYKVAVRCCAGNHDITHLEQFCNFAEKFIESEELKEDMNTCYSYVMKEEDTEVIFVNSASDGNYDYGNINYKKLKRMLKNCKCENKVIVMHHAIMNMYADDKSALRDALKFVNIVEEYNVKFVLHGHIHGSVITPIGEGNIKSIGVGALFTRGNTNVNSQLNIIEYHKGYIVSVKNYKYAADDSKNTWLLADLGKNIEPITNFKGNSFTSVHKSLITQLEIYGTLNNVTLNIKGSYDEIKQDIGDNVEKDTIESGGGEYTCKELGEMWQDTSTAPLEKLYFTHGSRYNLHPKYNSVAEFVAEKLKINRTSNRVILLTSDMDCVLKSFDDEKNFLPSMMSIQFGYDEKTNELLVAMNLRALEAKRFLKINICEIMYLLRSLELHQLKFSSVNIMISSFRVHIRDNFSCFFKCRIDYIKVPHLSRLVNNKKTSELIELLEEKKNSSETIINIRGIKELKDCLEDYLKMENNTDPYDKSMLKKLEKILSNYREIDGLHKSTSEHDPNEKKLENEIHDLFDEIINKLKKYEEKSEEI